MVGKSEKERLGADPKDTVRLDEALIEAQRTRPERFARYIKILRVLPWERGSLADGTHRIVFETERMALVEEASICDYAMRGLDPRDGRVGVVWEDAVSVVVAHPIRSADGKTLRTWKAVYWWNGLKGRSVALVPYTDDGRVLMVPAWRGPVVGRWELEFPGGGKLDATRDVEAVRAEMFEEAGYEMLGMERLGGDEVFVVDPSTNGTPIALYAVRLGQKVGQRPERGEVFGRPMLLTRAELEAAFRQGFVRDPGDPDGRRLCVLDGRNGICALMAIIHGLVR